MKHRPGETRLRASLRRLRAGVSQRLQPTPSPFRVDPANEFEQSIDDRLTAIERKVSDQNRLLLLTMITIGTDLAVKLAEWTGR